MIDYIWCYTVDWENTSQKQTLEENYEYVEQKTVEINLETAAKAPDRGEAIDTKG